LISWQLTCRGKQFHCKIILGNIFYLLFGRRGACHALKKFLRLKPWKAKYPDEKMEVIFVTLDADSLKFANAVKKYELNWTHIFNNIEVLKKYGVLSIPQVYLIDRSGTIIYSRAEEKDQKLAVLADLLALRISN